MCFKRAVDAVDENGLAQVCASVPPVRPPV